MAINKTNGDKGEAIAANYLREKGYTILERNYRYKRAEIDIIATNGNRELLVFVEVKARSSQNFGFPEEAVDEKKSELIIMAANHYITESAWENAIRFDIIAITFLKEVEILHLQDAFY